MAQSFQNPSERMSRVSVKMADSQFTHCVQVISLSHQFKDKPKPASKMHIVQFSHQYLPCVFHLLIIFSEVFLGLSLCLAEGYSATLSIAQEVLRLGHWSPEHFIWYFCSNFSSYVQCEKLSSLTLWVPLKFLLSLHHGLFVSEKSNLDSGPVCGRAWDVMNG